MFVQMREQNGWFYFSIQVRYRNREGKVISYAIYLGPDPVITRQKVLEKGLDPEKVAKLVVGTVKTHEGNCEIMLPVVEEWNLQTLQQCDAVWQMREQLFKETVAWFNLAILLPLPRFENLALVHQAACEAAELAFDRVRKETQSLEGGPRFLRELYAAALAACVDFVEHPPPSFKPAPSALDPRFWEVLRQENCETRIGLIMSHFSDQYSMREPQIDLARRVHREHRSICPACKAEMRESHEKRSREGEE